MTGGHKSESVESIVQRARFTGSVGIAVLTLVRASPYPETAPPNVLRDAIVLKEKLLTSMVIVF